jgi:hypothetical protein
MNHDIYHSIVSYKINSILMSSINPSAILALCYVIMYCVFTYSETAPNVGWHRSLCCWFRSPNGTISVCYVPVHNEQRSLPTTKTDRLESLSNKSNALSMWWEMSLPIKEAKCAYPHFYSPWWAKSGMLRSRHILIDLQYIALAVLKSSQHILQIHLAYEYMCSK